MISSINISVHNYKVAKAASHHKEMKDFMVSEIFGQMMKDRKF